MSMRLILAILLILVGFDAIATMILVGFGYATEMNPVADLFLTANPWLLLVVKILETFLGCLFLYKYRTKKAVRIAVAMLMVLYSGIALLHITSFLLWTPEVPACAE